MDQVSDRSLSRFPHAIHLDEKTIVNGSKIEVNSFGAQCQALPASDNISTGSHVIQCICVSILSSPKKNNTTPTSI